MKKIIYLFILLMFSLNISFAANMGNSITTIKHNNIIYEVKNDYSDMVIHYPLQLGTFVFEKKLLPALIYEKYDFGIVFLKAENDLFYKNYIIKNNELLPCQKIENNDDPVYFFPMPKGLLNGIVEKREIEIENNVFESYLINGECCLYGIDTSGEYNVYIYDENEHKLQKVNLNDFANIGSDNLNNKRILIFVLVALFISIISCIYIKKRYGGVKYRKR